MDGNGSLRLPSANEFSPGQVKLSQTLRLVASNAGNRDAIVSALGSQGSFGTKRANNICIGLSGYGLFDLKTNAMTAVGQSICGIKSEKEQLKAFGKHMLQSLNGIEIIAALQSVQDRGDGVTKLTLAKELSRRGFTSQTGKRISSNTTDHTFFVGWLVQAGVLSKEMGGQYSIDEVVFKELSGASPATIDSIYSLSRGQRAVLRTLKRHTVVAGKEQVLAQIIKRNCIIQFGDVFKREDQLDKEVWEPLAKAGWIMHKVKKHSGRGGKSGYITPTQQLLDIDPGSIGIGEFNAIPYEVRQKLDMPVKEVLADLQSKNTHVKGLALEVLTVKLCYELGLIPVRFRERSVETGGAETDIIADGINLHYSRWLLQCKNTPSQKVNVDTLAKEVGMGVLLKAHVIVLITTGQFTQTVRQYAAKLAQETPYQVVLIDGELLRSYQSGDSANLLEFFQREAVGTQRIKLIQVSKEAEGKD